MTNYPNEKDNGSGLHVVDVEFPPQPPRYSRIRSLRIPSLFNPNRLSTISSRSHSQRQPSIPSTPAIPSTVALSSTQRPSSINSPILSEPVSEPESQEEDKETILDRRWLGWTWRRWAFVLGPCLAIVVMVVVLVAVFVSRMQQNQGTSTDVPVTSSGNSTTPSTNATAPLGPVSAGACTGGAYNGTSIASADPGISDPIWVFYQDPLGNLCYIPRSNNGQWRSPIQIPVPNDSILNGTAITALNFAKGNKQMINLFYQDSSGDLANFLYNNVTGQFQIGKWGSQNTAALPTNPDLIRRMSWYADNVGYSFFYYSGNDGLIHEYILNEVQTQWRPSYTFNNSNGYSGCTVLYDSSSQTATMHLINSAGQIQQYWRAYTNSTNASSTTAPPDWIAGTTIPSTSTPLGFDLNINATLTTRADRGVHIFAQENGGKGTIWEVGWKGSRDKMVYLQGNATNLVAMQNSDVAIQFIDGSFGETNALGDVLLQQVGDDITRLVKMGDGNYQFAERLPLG